MTQPLAAAAAVALLELDAVYAFQVMVSRPIVFAPLLGAAQGQPALGFLVGLLWETLTLEAPVGGHMPLNATAGAGATLLLALGQDALPVHAAVPVGIAAGWAHRKLEAALRQRRAGRARACDRRLAAGLTPRLGLTAAGELGKQAGMTFAVLAAVLALKPVLATGWDAAGQALRGACEAGFWAGPWLGMAALLRALKVAA